MGGPDWGDVSAGGAAAIVGGALLWLIYFDTKDAVHKEPRHLLLAAFGLGSVAGALGLVGFVVAEKLGLPRGPGAGLADVLVYCLLVIGPVEEGAKFAVARASVFRWQAFDEEIDGLVYAAAIAIGFATFESFLYLPHHDGTRQLARAATAPLTHALFASVWGLGAARALLVQRSRASRWLWQAGSLALAMGLHGLYDALLFGWGATVLAAATILAIWLFAIGHGKRAAARRRAT